MSFFFHTKIFNVIFYLSNGDSLRKEEKILFHIENVITNEKLFVCISLFMDRLSLFFYFILSFIVLLTSSRHLTKKLTKEKDGQDSRQKHTNADKGSSKKVIFYCRATKKLFCGFPKKRLLHNSSKLKEHSLIHCR